MMRDSRPRVLVTGGAGFIGSNLVDYLIGPECGWHVTVLDALTYAGCTDHLPLDKIEFVYGNVLNHVLVDQLVAQADVVVHLAAETHVTRSIHENRHFFETDVLGTQVVANACLRHRDRVQRLVHISTSEVYGTSVNQGVPMREDHPLRPMSPYAAAKCGADRLIESYWHTYNLPVTIVRPFNVYGPRQHVEKAIARFMTTMIKGRDAGLPIALPLHGGGIAERDYTYVSDVCRAIGMLMVEGTGFGLRIFNVASGVGREMQSVAMDVGRVFGSEICVAELSDRPGQVLAHWGDAGLLRDQTGWTPRVQWQDGLSYTRAWYEAHPHIWERQLWAKETPITTAAGTIEAH